MHTESTNFGVLKQQERTIEVPIEVPRPIEVEGEEVGGVTRRVRGESKNTGRNWAFRSRPGKQSGERLLGGGKVGGRATCCEATILQA
eukprot:696847-Pleurochrysis_carterae.AAC.1